MSDLDHNDRAGPVVAFPERRPCRGPRSGTHIHKGHHMKRTSWILGSIAALVLAACGGGAPGGDAGAAGGAGTETGSPGMTTDTAPAPGPMDTAMTGTSATDTTTASTDTSKP